MRPFICILLSVLLPGKQFAAVRGEQAEYVGGTVSTIKQGVQGTLAASDDIALRFTFKDGEFAIPYSQIVTLEFGQKVGRRVGAAIGGFVALGLPGLLILMSKKKKHFLTIGYRSEDGKGQAAVFELAKDTVSNILPALEARTGKRVEREVGDGWNEVGHAATPHVPGPPPPPRVEPLPFSLTIEATPSGAEIIIDSKPFGPAPLTVKLAAGQHYMALRKDGFITWTRDVDAKAGDSMTISADLKPVEEISNVIVVKPSAPRQ
jgi:PEGA domain